MGKPIRKRRRIVRKDKPSPVHAVKPESYDESAFSKAAMFDLSSQIRKTHQAMRDTLDLLGHMVECGKLSVDQASHRYDCLIAKLDDLIEIAQLQQSIPKAHGGVQRSRSAQPCLR